MCLEDERKLNEKTMSEYKEIMQRQKGENKDLQAKENELTVLRDDFNRYVHCDIHMFTDWHEVKYVAIDDRVGFLSVAKLMLFFKFIKLGSVL